MQDTELEWKLCARSPSPAVADSKGRNASTGALQVEIFTFQPTIHTLKTMRVLVCGQSII
jgi:hypothetical protein